MNIPMAQYEPPSGMRRFESLRHAGCGGALLRVLAKPCFWLRGQPPCYVSLLAGRVAGVYALCVLPSQEMLHLFGVRHAGQGQPLVPGSDTEESDPTSCMGCAQCVASGAALVCPNAPQVGKPWRQNPNWWDLIAAASPCPRAAC